MIKEIFINSCKCAYNARIQEDLLDCYEIVCLEFRDRLFNTYENGVGGFAYDSIMLCLNFKEITVKNETTGKYDTACEGANGEIYNIKPLDVFTVKHKEEWYDAIWSCVTEGKGDINELFEEALKDVEAYNRKLSMIRSRIDPKELYEI